MQPTHLGDRYLFFISIGLQILGSSSSCVCGHVFIEKRSIGGRRFSGKKICVWRLHLHLFPTSLVVWLFPSMLYVLLILAIHTRCSKDELNCNFVVNTVSLILFLTEYRANLYTRLTMAQRRRERKSRYDMKETRPAIIVKQLDQRKVINEITRVLPQLCASY